MQDPFMWDTWRASAVEAGAEYTKRPPRGARPRDCLVFQGTRFVPESLNAVEAVRIDHEDYFSVDTIRFWERLKDDVLAGQLAAQWIELHQREASSRLWPEFSVLYCFGDIWVDQDHRDGDWFPVLRRSKRTWVLGFWNRRNDVVQAIDEGKIGYLRIRR